MEKIYEINYIKAHDDIEEEKTLYCKAECVEDAFIFFMKNNTVYDFNLDDHLETVFKSTEDKLYYYGEVLDNISRGGDFNYYNVTIWPIELNAIFVKSEVTLKELEAFNLASLKATFNIPILPIAPAEWETYLNKHQEFRF